ncbi:hypothetical protein [Thioalkalivibrio sp. ALMg11]|uniref:hypothetical protein n=1 Tax=Thioalkalivibrio sp. ALMg11 TaxID=1158165 RepID=UPI00035F8601|nr:hypothetical protein [Thioalkalivibrio sp. ALMg11]
MIYLAKLVELGRVTGAVRFEARSPEEARKEAEDSVDWRKGQWAEVSQWKAPEEPLNLLETAGEPGSWADEAEAGDSGSD